MAIKNSAVSVGTTATALSSAADTGGVPGSAIAVVPAAQIFVGTSDVTTETGFPVAANATFTADLGPGEALYGVAASGTVSVQVLEIGV